jgi:hypothetical protein
VLLPRLSPFAARMLVLVLVLVLPFLGSSPGVSR